MSKQFLQEFIHCLQNEPALWQAKSDAYKNKNIRNKSWEVLVNKFKEVDQEATIDTVKKKVNSLRATYRRELQKIKRSEKSGAGVDDIYKPSIWYFSKLHFLYEQESFVDGINTFDDGPEIEIPKDTKCKSDEGAEFLQKAVVHLDTISEKKTRDDAEIFAEGWAVMFRQMSKEQQLFAKKGIDELLMQGQMNMLTYQGVSSIARLPNNQDYSTAPVYQMPVPAYPRQKIYVSNLLASDSDTASSFMSEDTKAPVPVFIPQNKNARAKPNQNGTNADEPSHVNAQTERKRKICRYCPYQKRRMTKAVCIKCKNNMCGEHKVELCVSCSKC